MTAEREGRGGGGELVASSGNANLSTAGKREIAKSMFGKGCAFLGAYILLRQADQSEPTEYVALQNLCQSVEVVLKSLFLFKNYDAFRPQFGKRNGFGHDLIKLANAVIHEYSRHSLSIKSAKQLQQLSEFYANHRLRYGNGLDLFRAPQSIERKRVVRLLAHVIKITLLGLR
jgi:hypothetical protein